MKRNYLLLLIAMLCFAGEGSAQTTQRCATDDAYKAAKKLYPQIEMYEKMLEEQTKNYLSKRDMGAARTTASATDTEYFDIPLVVHVVHNYGPEFLTDNQVYSLIAEMNRFYNLQYDYSSVISVFQPYVGKARIRFYLATKDPLGNPTTGIIRHHSYLTYGYNEQAKLEQWPQSSYINIWFIYQIGRNPPPGAITVAYATPPASAAANPQGDGIISNYSYIADANNAGAKGGSIDHEMGHIFNLAHTYGRTNEPGTNKSGDCGDDDDVDDTPPTRGSFACLLYDTVCARNYYKIYPKVSGIGDSLVNYPDTANEQNIMNYATCKVNFTKGQVERMRAALSSDVGFRNNLWDSTNLFLTGAKAPRPDLKPVPEFAASPNDNGLTSIDNYPTRSFYFTFPGTPVKFRNMTWRDTVTTSTWTFSNSAATPTITYATPATVLNSVTNSFSDPGWVTLTMKETGNGSGDTTMSWNRALFVADNTGTPGIGYFQEFGGADTAKWPVFNYYDNNLKWKMANVGYYDNSSVQFVGYDDRLNPAFGQYPYTGNPHGDYDDLYSIPMDLSGYSGPCSLNFYYSGASRSSMSLNVTDVLEISYSVGKSNTWTTLTNMTKSSLANKGAYSFPYAPLSTGDWALFSMNVPSAARTPYTVFRFRYKPGISVGFDGTIYSGAYSSGNNFYMDRITFSPYPAGVDNMNLGKIDVAVAPNPTSGDAYVIVKDADNATANVTVSDITGKVVYTTSQQLSGGEARILIPQSSISVSGMYLVQTITGNQVRTLKLVVQ